MIKYLVKKKLKLNDKKFLKVYSKSFLKEHKLNFLLKIYTPWQLIEITYPNKFKEWEFCKLVSNKFFKENLNMLIHWTIKFKLKISENNLGKNSILRIYNDPTFTKLLAFNNKTPFELINMVYPNKLSEKDFKNII